MSTFVSAESSPIDVAKLEKSLLVSNPQIEQVLDFSIILSIRPFSPISETLIWLDFI
jgi:hypothetical protein